jgi:nucleoside-diphosphate-sugar epimerase
MYNLIEWKNQLCGRVKMKVLFIGGTGIISSAVSKLALEKGIDLYLFNRNNQKEFTPEGAKIIKGDIRREDEAKEILKDYSFDVVVNWIAFTPEHIGTDLRLFRDKTKQYIFISSASAYQKPPENFIITEKTPLSNPFWEYSRSKIACEELLFEEYSKNGFPATVVRPSHTYGNTLIPCILNSHRSRWSVVERMKRGKRIIVPGDGTSLWVLTHNSDFAKAFVGLMGNPKAIGEAFQITSDEALTWDQITNLIGEAVGVKPDIVHMSTDFITACIPELHSELVGDKINSVYFDNSKIKSLVPDFICTTPAREGIRRTIKWYLSHPELLWLDEEWDAMCDRLIAAHEAGISAYKA